MTADAASHRPAQLPLAIVYVGWGVGSIFRNHPEQTILFYWYEPDVLISHRQHIMRVDFDHPVACEPGATNVYFGTPSRLKPSIGR